MPGPRWRASLRLARRQVWRTKGASLLVAALILLPVAGLSGAAVFWQSHQASPAQRAALQLGRAQALFTVVGAPDPTRQQAVDDPGVSRVATDQPGVYDVAGPLPATATHVPTNPNAIIPAGTTTVKLGLGGSAYVDTATGTGRIGVTTGPAWDPVFTGRFVRVAGHAPTAADEAMVSPGTLQRLGAHVGGRLTLTDSGRSFTITGTMRAAGTPADVDEIFLPASAGALVDGQTAMWFTTNWQPDWAQFQAASRAGFGVYARAIAMDPPAGSLQMSRSDSTVWVALLIGSIAAVFGGYLVVLLAGAAFAVSARRQQRTLAMTASVGATRRDVFRIVLLQGAVLGLAAGVLGAATGIGAAAIGLAVTDHGVVGSFWGNWGFRVPWLLMVAITVFAVVVGTAAAIMPARAATRGDVLGALRGSRAPARMNARRPVSGLVLMAIGTTVTVTGAVGLVAQNAAGDSDPTHPLRLALLAGLVAGPVLFQVGVIVGGDWVLAMVARGLSRCGLSARIAARDAAAHPSRIVPAFAAIAACVFVATAALSITAVQSASGNDYYTWNGGPGTVSVTASSVTPQNAGRTTSVLEGILAPSHPSATALVETLPDPQTNANGKPVDPDAPVWSILGATKTGRDCNARCMIGSDAGNTETVDGAALWAVKPAQVSTVIGSALPAAAERVLAGGGAVALMPHGANLRGGTETEVWLGRWTAGALTRFNDAVNASGQLSAKEIASLPLPTVRRHIPLVFVTPRYPQQTQAVLVSWQTARRLGVQTSPHAVLASYRQPPSDAVVDAMTAAAANVRIGTNTGVNVYVERGPASADPTMWVITAAAMVLVVAAGAVCLGLSRFERRSDDATLAAVGATRRLRRRVGAWQASIVVGLGTVVGTVAALISVWGITHVSSSLPFGAVPWPWLMLLAVGLPAGMAAASWLVPPGEPDLTHRTAIA